MVGLKTSCAVLTLTLVFIACYVEFTSAAGAQLVLSGTVRDQAPNTMAHNRFPADYWSYNGWTDNPTLGSCGNANNSQGWANTDFELPLYYYGTIKTPNAKGGVLYNGEVGLVGGVCNATNQWVNCGKLNPDDHTPIYAHTGPSPFGTIRSPQSFATWFHAGPTTIAVPYNLTLTQSTGRLYTYNAPFFPIDGRGWADSNQGDTNGVNHNFAFCFEIHGHFSYQGGETFSFTGDDDVWVYLDSRLMIDLGGIHTQLSATVNLDDIAGLTRGNNYRFDFFYCERHTTASDMQITTSLEIACTYYDWCDICEGTGQSCCTAQDLIECADTNACTNDSCAVLVPPQTGCQHVDITPTCPGNKCFLAGCDPAIGCTQTPVPCNDGKRCTVDTCVNSTGCVFTNYQCPGDACNVAVCSETGTMCTTTKTNCDDNNACTVDTCDPVHGCQHVALVCAQDFCHSSTCDTVAGCQNTTKNCDDSNACTKDTCDNASGCKNTQIPCGNGDKCLTFNCDPNTGCANATKSCDDNNVCTIDTCNSVTGCSNVQDPCDDGNACTIDTCSPTLGGCQHNPLPCDDHNMCTNNTCDPLSGCVYPPIVCNDNNACTNDTCIPASGCYYPPLVCSSSDKCVNATCDIVSGCQFPSISCNDQNPCTADSCDHASGCKNVPTDCNHCAYPNGSYVYCAPEGGNWCFPLSCDPNSGNCNISQPVVCNDQNACTNDTCNGADGTCSYPKITCNDNNPCTQDTCNPNSGCVFTNNTCDDNNPCTMDSCNHADGSCINTPVAGNCIACGPDPCTWTDVCNPKVCDNNVCTVQPYSCDDGNLCTNDVCDNSGVNATCHFPQKNCTAADACNPSSCDLTSGQCLTTPFDCDDANPCTDDTCSVGTDGKPVCANNRRDCPGSTACLPQVCNEDTGECEINNPPSCDDLNYCTDDNCVSITDSVWNCTHDTHDCTGFDTGNLCVLPICIPDTGCAPAASSICDDGNFCTDDECVGPLNCTHTLTSICDDNDACTNDFCDPSLAQADACSHTNLTCYPPTICQNATGCNVTTGCIFEPLVCVLNTTDFCLVPNCDLTAGCIPIPRTCLVDDPGCYQGVCDSVLGQCTQQALPDWTTITSSKGNGLSCYAYYNKGELAGIITGGAIAGIVVGAVVFAAAATVAARKAYLYAQLRAGGMGAAQANPLYTPGATEGVNPLFT